LSRLCQPEMPERPHPMLILISPFVIAIGIVS
jgi:hypothetical protein